MRRGGLLCLCFLYFYFAVIVEAGAGDTNTDDVCNFCAWDTCNPSVVGIDENQFNPETDANTIWGAIGYVFVDKEKLFSILTDRTEKQRLSIVSTYKKLHKGNLMKEDVEDIIFGDARTVLNDLLIPLAQFYAKYLKTAIENQDIAKMAEIFTILPPCAIQQVHTQYEAIHRVLLNDDISVSLGRKYPVETVVKPILLLAKGNRPQPTNKRGTKDWNKKIDQDVKGLIKVIEQDKHNDKISLFKELFIGRTLPQIQDIIRIYEQRQGLLEKSIEKAGFERATVIYTTIANIAKSQPEYFAKKIKELLNTRFMWTVDRPGLNFIVVGRSGIDLGDVKKAFRELYGSSLYVTILKKITRRNNDYYKAILSLIKQD